jgi:type IV fimbrial biogenesis protein FimT
MTRVFRQRGFTLIELIVTISIVGILLALAAPSFGEASLGSKLAATANRLLSSATLARSEAIKRNASITMCASSDGLNCAGSGGWEVGWIVKNGSTVLQYEPAAAAGLKITEAGGAVTVNFPATVLDTAGAIFNFTICRYSPSVGSQERVLKLDAARRAFVQKTTAGACV